ncbi:MAG: hypothetical protein F2793_05225 [Actinobacteria bacterium]|uniref:Unannotated protein n=1 Tax=freshwater metagenome TaxID=449393 RepID=A0A6J7E8S2_9ZZZZ|nr:hypothetical protein [Actinomycetota bacterium]
MRIAALLVVTGTCLAVTLSGCSASDAMQVDGQVTQQRRDQIKRVVSVRLTFGDPDPIVVTDVRLVSPAFVRQSQVAWHHRPVRVQPGVPVALPIALAAADCTTPASSGPPKAIVTVSDAQGQSRTIELADLSDSGLLGRLRDHDCAVASLEERATLTLGTHWKPAERDGRRVWRGYVDVERTTPYGSPIEVTEALGSVLVDFTPMEPLPWRLPDRVRSRLPIEASSSGRCDGHSMGESSKPFVFTLWVTTDGLDVPLVLAVTKADSAAWWELLASACAAAPASG